MTYLGLEWFQQKVHLFVRGYSEKASQLFPHTYPMKTQHQHHPHIPLPHEKEFKMQHWITLPHYCTEKAKGSFGKWLGPFILCTCSQQHPTNFMDYYSFWQRTFNQGKNIKIQTISQLFHYTTRNFHHEHSKQYNNSYLQQFIITQWAQCKQSSGQ